MGAEHGMGGPEGVTGWSDVSNARVLATGIASSSQKYLHKYLTDIEHDNTYVTRYYRKIDARRKRIGKHTLLPLKKIEKSKMIDLRSYRLVDRESDYLVGRE